jgi:hypothetical protein
MTKDRKTGYSEALGGYGVPSQVAVTGESEPKMDGGAKPRKGKSFSFSTRNKILIAVAAAVVLVVVLWLTGVLGGSQYASSIASIEKDSQSVNGANVTNYLPQLAEDVDWTALSDEKRAGIAKYAVGKALEQAEADQAGIYNIMGQATDEQGIQPIFLYANDGMIQIRVNGEVTDTISVK